MEGSSCGGGVVVSKGSSRVFQMKSELVTLTFDYVSRRTGPEKCYSHRGADNGATREWLHHANGIVPYECGTSRARSRSRDAG